MKKEIKEQANFMLADMRRLMDSISRVEAQAEASIKKVEEEYAKELQPLRDMLAVDEKALLKLMKANHKYLFGDGDLVDLKAGVLLYSEALKVSIPRNALQKVKDNGFNDVIKKVESLDREAVEKWPDEKLFLIGAARKPAKEYNYEIKNEDGTKRPKPTPHTKSKGDNK